MKISTSEQALRTASRSTDWIARSRSPTRFRVQNGDRYGKGRYRVHRKWLGSRCHRTAPNGPMTVRFPRGSVPACVSGSFATSPDRPLLVRLVCIHQIIGLTRDELPDRAADP